MIKDTTPLFSLHLYLYFPNSYYLKKSNICQLYKNINILVVNTLAFLKLTDSSQSLCPYFINYYVKKLHHC